MNNSLGWIAIAFAIVLLTMAVVTTWLFALIHAVQRIDSPAERTRWVLWLLLFNVFGAVVYFCTKYRQLRIMGMGRLLSVRESLNNKRGQ